jgi:hypothetical protein
MSSTRTVHFDPELGLDLVVRLKMEYKDTDLSLISIVKKVSDEIFPTSRRPRLCSPPALRLWTLRSEYQLEGLPVPLAQRCAKLSRTGKEPGVYTYYFPQLTVQ